jgi:hypothetical protein
MLIDRFNETADKWTPQGYTFKCVYILEAHAVDEWPVSMTERDVKQHTCLSDRLVAANDFLQDFALSPNMPLLLDGDDNQFNSTYSSWPFRFWVLSRVDEETVKVSFKPMPKNASYDVNELDSWLEGDLCRRAE